MTGTDDLEELAQALLAQHRRDGMPEDWATRLPHGFDTQRALATVFDRMGIEAYNGGDLKLAKEALWHNLMLRLQVVRAHPQSRVDIRDFASAQDVLGQVTLSEGQIDVASDLISEALGYREGLSRDDPTDAHAAYLYGLSLWHRAKLERARNDATAERAWITRAKDQLERLNSAIPGIAFVEDGLRHVVTRAGELDRALLP